MATTLKKPASVSQLTKRPARQAISKGKALPAKRPAGQVLDSQDGSQLGGQAGTGSAVQKANILKQLLDDDHAFCQTFKSRWDCSAGGGGANMKLFLEARYCPDAIAHVGKKAKSNEGKIGKGDQVHEALAEVTTFILKDCAAEKLDCAGDVVKELNFSTCLMGCSNPKYPEPGFECLVESFQTTGVTMLEAVRECVRHYNSVSESAITNVEVDSDDAKDIYGPAYCEGDNFDEIEQLQNPQKTLENDRGEGEDSEDDGRNREEIRQLQKSECNVEVGRTLRFLSQGRHEVLIVTVSAKLRTQCDCYNPVTGGIDL